MIRVVLPAHLKTVAKVSDDVVLDVPPPVSLAAVLDALEARYPVLQGPIRNQQTMQRRPFIRFFACGQDLSHDPPDNELPEKVTAGEEPLLVVGAVAGG